MVLEQEIASIARFILDNAAPEDGTELSPYYWKVPQSFAVPAVYFPIPEIDTDGDTLAHFGMDYVMYVCFFDRTSEDAYRYALKAVTSIRSKRNLIPLIGMDGQQLEGRWVRIDDPDLRMPDNGAAQLQIRWRSRRPYERGESVKMMTVDVDYRPKAPDSVTEAFLERYLYKL